jgi:hypothetical protein
MFASDPHITISNRIPCLVITWLRD